MHMMRQELWRIYYTLRYIYNREQQFYKELTLHGCRENNVFASGIKQRWSFEIERTSSALEAQVHETSDILKAANCKKEKCRQKKLKMERHVENAVTLAMGFMCWNFTFSDTFPTGVGTNSNRGQISINIGYFLGMLATYFNDSLIILTIPN